MHYHAASKLSQVDISRRRFFALLLIDLPEAEAEVPESASKEKNKPEKHNVKKDKKERKVDEDKDKTVKDKKNAKSSKKETEQDTDVCKVQVRPQSHCGYSKCMCLSSCSCKRGAGEEA